MPGDGLPYRRFIENYMELNDRSPLPDGMFFAALQRIKDAIVPV
jgi:hypothetical protein